jgi:bacteriorhodopsin
MAQPGAESIWLWIGTLGMTLGMVYFIASGWNMRDPEQELFYVITIFITAIAAASYFAMATGFGLIEIEVAGEALDIYWARYADWLFTTPLLLLDLALLARADRNTIYTLVGLDVFMIATGLVGALVTAAVVFRLTWWGISTGALLFLLYFLVRSLGELSGDLPAEVSTLVNRLQNLLIVLWLAYPVVWIVGTEGLGPLPLYWETAAFMLLDLSAKVGFGFVLLRSHSVLDAATDISRARATAP